MAASLEYYLTPPEVLDDRGHGFLVEPDLRRLPAHLRPDGRGALQLDAPAGDLRLPDRRRDRSPRGGRGDLAVHVPGTVRGRLVPAPLPAPSGGRVVVVDRRWKKCVFFYIPLTLFLVGMLFPFYWMLITAIRPDAELYRSWRNVHNTPFWTLHPTLDHVRDLLARTMFPRWLWNTFFIATVSTGISLFCGLLAGYALARLKFPMARSEEHTSELQSP